MKLENLKAFLFPLRTHLEREIEYLKIQLAQERRRVDVLMERPAQKPLPTAKELIKQPRNRPTPIGWDATRAQERADAAQKAEHVSAGLDAGSETPAEGNGTTG